MLNSCAELQAKLAQELGGPGTITDENDQSNIFEHKCSLTLDKCSTNNSHNPLIVIEGCLNDTTNSWLAATYVWPQRACKQLSEYVEVMIDAMTYKLLNRCLMDRMLGPMYQAPKQPGSCTLAQFPKNGVCVKGFIYALAEVPCKTTSLV